MRANTVFQLLRKKSPPEGRLRPGREWGCRGGLSLPTGPAVAPACIPRTASSACVDGEELQESWTSDLLSGLRHLVFNLGAAMTLQSGDVIITETQSDVERITPGDILDIWAEGVGTLTSPIVAEAA